MSIEVAEKLKRLLTDQFVLVEANVPELRRFAQKTGQVKTVNMNGRALVQFLETADVTWYDIDPAYLKVVEAPIPPAPVEVSPVPPRVVADAAPAAKPKAASPLDLIRAQQATKGRTETADVAEPVTAEAEVVATKKPLSPLELIRQQQAAKQAVATAGSGSPSRPAEIPEKPLSPLEQIRQQQAAKAVAPAAEDAQPVESESLARKLSPLELIRQQQAAKQAQKDSGN